MRVSMAVLCMICWSNYWGCKGGFGFSLPWLRSGIEYSTYHPTSLASLNNCLDKAIDVH